MSSELGGRVVEYITRYRCATLPQLEQYTRVSRLTLRVALCDLMLEHNIIHMRVAGTHVFCVPNASYIDAVEAAMKSARIVPSAVRRELRELIENAQSKTVYITTARIARNVYHSAYVIMLLHEYIKALLDGAIADVVLRGRGTHRRTLFVVDREKALQRLHASR